MPALARFWGRPGARLAPRAGLGRKGCGYWMMTLLIGLTLAPAG